MCCVSSATHMKESNDKFCIGAIFLIRAMLRCTFEKIKLFLSSCMAKTFLCVLAVRFSLFTFREMTYNQLWLHVDVGKNTKLRTVYKRWMWPLWWYLFKLEIIGGEARGELPLTTHLNQFIIKSKTKVPVLTPVMNEENKTIFLSSCKCSFLGNLGWGWASRCLLLLSK